MEKKEKEIKKDLIKIDFEKAESHKKIIIEGIEIYFPYNPYPPQRDYMKKIILTLKNKGNISALESPTGTGKTLCLLCSVLGWQYYHQLNNKDINIYYCTRTVSQIKNVMKELKKTCYILHTSFLTSRKFTCVNCTRKERNEYDISKLNDLCEFWRKENLCVYYYKDQDYYKLFENDNLDDIEDLFKEGKEKQFCPYFYSLKKTESYADITFMSYNYLLNPFIRNRLKKTIHENSIILLDEAHNICNVFEDLYSTKIKKKDLEKIHFLLQIILDYSNVNKKDIYKLEDEINPLFKLNEKDINEQITFLNNFINELNLLEPDKNKLCKKIDDHINNNCYLCNIDYFRIIFKEISFFFYESLTDAINKLNSKEEKDINNFYKDNIKKYNQKIKFKSVLKKPKRLSAFLYQLYTLKKEEEISFKLIFSNENQTSIQKFEKKNKKDKKEKKKGIFFEIYCIDASYGMQDLLKINPYSIILTSGTLSIKNLENLLRVNFKETLHNNHVVNNSQFLANIIPSFTIKNIKYDYSFILKNRGNEEQILSLGKEIYNMAKSVKIGGILVFFQSYDFLNYCFKVWIENNIVLKYESIKNTIFDFYYRKDENEELIKEGKKNNNLLLFTVYRGKNSEGINFPDDEARMVICIGVPYPNLSDIKVKLKKDLRDEKYEKERKGLRGYEWYREEAMVAVNQSLGRLIRSKNDYGIMICFGIELLNNSFLFSKWIKNNITYVNLKEDNEEYYKKIEYFLFNLQNNNNNTINSYSKKKEYYSLKKDDDSDFNDKDDYYYNDYNDYNYDISTLFQRIKLYKNKIIPFFSFP